MSSGIKRNFFFSSILTTANYVFPLLTYPYVSRVLGANGIGICNFVDSIVTYFLMFSMMGITILGIRETAINKKQTEKLSEVFSNLFVLNTIFTIIVFIAYVLFCVFVSEMQEYKSLAILGGFKIIFNYLLIEWFYKGLEEFRYITLRTLCVKCLYVFSVFLFVRDKEDYGIYYALSVFMIVFNAVINVKHCGKYVSFSFKNLNIVPYIKPYLILGADLICGAMYTTFNTAYLGFVSNTVEVGYYTTATKLYFICISLFSAFTGVMMPRMTSLYAEGNMDEYRDKLYKSTKLLFTFSVPLVLFVVIDASDIIYIIAGDGFSGAITPMRIIMPLMIVLGYKQIIILQGLLPIGKNKMILGNSAIGAIVGLILNIAIVPFLHATGSAIVWLLTEISGGVLSSYFISRCIGLRFPFGGFIREILWYMPLALALIFLLLNGGNMVVRMSLSVLLLIIYFLIKNLYFSKNTEVCNILISIKKRIHV